ncbi:hypothetical protein BGP_5828 [Beggiatoa sp. PS]|nr:hypothetical protein BGP_5828 [Beggiatoa sp. PS]
MFCVIHWLLFHQRLFFTDDYSHSIFRIINKISKKSLVIRTEIKKRPQSVNAKGPFFVNFDDNEIQNPPKPTIYLF